MLTRAVPDLKSHPFKRLMDAGVRTTVNTDDHGVMDISLIQECEHLTTHLGVTLEEGIRTPHRRGVGQFVDDLTTQLVSLCGDDMNVQDAMGNSYTMTYDGTGYINPFFGMQPNGQLQPL